MLPVNTPNGNEHPRIAADRAALTAAVKARRDPFSWGAGGHGTIDELIDVYQANVDGLNPDDPSYDVAVKQLADATDRRALLNARQAQADTLMYQHADLFPTTDIEIHGRNIVNHKMGEVTYIVVANDDGIPKVSWSVSNEDLVEIVYQNSNSCVLKSKAGHGQSGTVTLTAANVVGTDIEATLEIAVAQ